MPVQTYIWSASIDDIEFTISVVESCLDEARHALIQKLEKIQQARVEYAAIETKLQIVEQNQLRVDDKITDAHSRGDLKGQMDLERLHGYIRGGYHRILAARDTLSASIHLDISGLLDTRLASFGPDMTVHAVVFGETAFTPIIEKELTMREYIMTSFPTIRPFEKISISNM